MKHRYDALLWAGTSALLTATLLLCIGVPNVYAQSEFSANEIDDDYYELMRVFVDTFQQVDRNYVKEVDRRKLVDAAIRGMLAELDPYSNYIAPDNVERFTEQIEQKFGGVGIRVDFDQELRAIEIVSPIAGSPAYDAGIHAGDRIVEIDGEPVKDFPHDREMERAVELLRGAPGEEVEVVVRRAGSETEDRITLVRDVIELETVLGYSHKSDGSWNFILDDESKIGYARLTHFTERSAAELREALKQCRKDGMQGFILDLRFNPGGQLQSAIDIADLFIEEGTIVSVEGRSRRPRSWPAKRFGTFTGFPMAVLINRFSASASEIVSACLQDYDRAVVIGERSWGKGSVQNVIELENGDSALKLTTAGYQRPSGENIHRFPDSKEEDVWGVKPNEGFDLRFSRNELEQYQVDRRLRDNHFGSEAPQSDFVDTQLDKAIEYLKAELETSEENESGSKESDNNAAEKGNEAPADEKEAAALPKYLMVPKTENLG